MNKMGKNAVKDKWEKVKIGDILLKNNTDYLKVKTSEYLNEGKYPIVDQGSDFISGGSSEPSEDDIKIKNCLMDASKIMKIGIKFFAIVYEDKIRVY